MDVLLAKGVDLGQDSLGKLVGLEGKTHKNGALRTHWLPAQVTVQPGLLEQKWLPIRKGKSGAQASFWNSNMTKFYSSKDSLPCSRIYIAS